MNRLMRAALGAAMLAASAAAVASPLAKSYVVLGAEGADLGAAVARAGGTITRRLDGIDAVVAEGSGGFKSKVAKQPGVETVVPNVRVSWRPALTLDAVVVGAPGVPADTIGTGDDYLPLQWGHVAVKAPEAWAQGQRGAGARVAVLDTGFSLDHADIAGRYDASCTGDLTGEGIGAALPQGAHGMHVAGIIGAAANGVGTIGLAPDATLCLLKVASANGTGDIATVALGMIHAANRNADIINISMGGTIARAGVPGEYDSKEAREILRFFERAAKYAYKRGALVIASAGNEATQRDGDRNSIRLPTDTREVLTVAATTPVGWYDNTATSLDAPASYSNFGASIDLAAPGGENSPLVTGLCPFAGITPVRRCAFYDMVFSTGARVGGRDIYFWAQGTSQAAAHVSGVAALIVGKYGRMHPAQLRAYLNAGADDIGAAGRDDRFGVGRVNAVKSLAR
jgi:lantibiotic leader peptide-processing serine protease